MNTLYLASGSPRRQELLAQLGVTFERLIPGIEEQRHPQESAQQYVSRLAREKAQAGVALAPRDLPVLGADTIVILNGEVLEKPHDAAHAAAMLRKLLVNHLIGPAVAVQRLFIMDHKGLAVERPAHRVGDHPAVRTDQAAGQPFLKEVVERAADRRLFPQQAAV